MPILEEQCKKCGRVNERLYPRYQEETTPCECGGPTERVFSVAAFHDFTQSMGGTIHRPFATNNVHPDGKRMEFSTHKQLQDACKRYGVIHVPDKVR